MGELRSKLSRLSTRGLGAAAAAPPRVVAAPPTLEPWHVEATGFGHIHRVHCQHDVHAVHGRVRLDAFCRVLNKHVALLALCPSWQTVDLRRLLFLDTETTGLAGGAGTLPFLVGLGAFNDDGFHTEQLILRRPGEEVPLLRRLAERLDAASGIVTYNGKSFDWPLLRMRFIMNRVPMPQVLQHLDLLHCVRRVYKRRGTPLRLVNLERDLLQFHRVGDIDGAGIPELYFAYLRGAQAATLRPVIEHNRLDLAAMAAILGALNEVLDAPHAHAPFADCLSIAELTLRAGQAARAHSVVSEALIRPSAQAGPLTPRHQHVEAHLLVARLRRGQKDFVGCAAAYERALSSCDQLPELAARVHLALAKLYEHRLGDLPRAHNHAALTLGAEGAQAQQRRHARLQRKQQQRAAPRPAVDDVVAQGLIVPAAR